MFSQLRARVATSLAYLTNDEFDKLLTEQVHAGTSDELISPDWDNNLTIVDMVNHAPPTMSDKLWRILRRTLQAKSTNAKVLILSLVILETVREVKRPLKLKDPCTALYFPLTLSMLQVIKNCSSPVYQTLATSELWELLVKMATDNGATKVDLEVRDKILSIIEDYAAILPQKEYTDTYERLLEAGVDFPVRPIDYELPILSPPQPQLAASRVTDEVRQQARELAEGHQRQATHEAAVPQHPQRPQAQARDADVDPFAGMSEEDKAAVKKAMEELEGEEEAFRQAEAVAREAEATAAAAAIAEQMRTQDEAQRLIQQRQQQLLQIQQQREAAMAARQRNLRDLPAPREENEGVDQPLLDDMVDEYLDEYLDNPPHAPAIEQPNAIPRGGAIPYRATLAAAPPPPPPAAAAPPPARPERTFTFDETLQVISNTVSLLTDLLGDPSNNPQESFVSELAQECVNLQKKLERFIGGLEEEEKLAAALNQHEALRAVVSKYDEALAKAVGSEQVHSEGGGIAIGLPVDSLRPQRDAQAMTMAAAAATAASAGTAGNNARLAVPAVGGAGANFSLLGDDDDDDDGSMFTKVTQAVPPPATPLPFAPPPVTPPASNLLDLLEMTPPVPDPSSSNEPAPTTVPAPAPVAQPLSTAAGGLDFSDLTVNEVLAPPLPPIPQQSASKPAADTLDLI